MEEGEKFLFLRSLVLLGKRPFLVQCQMDELTPKTHSVVNNADLFNGVNVVYSQSSPFKGNPWDILEKCRQRTHLWSILSSFEQS